MFKGIICYKQKQFTDAESHYAKASDMLERSKCPLDHPYQIQIEKATSKLNRKARKAEINKKAEINIRTKGKINNIDNRARRTVRFKL